ncbi:MAG: hypothetical protein HC934_01780 [Acaryochloridaceae cyanobacterium SU_2_1]|nr:hypothetical protein [Acaryochloridaceae cyanobacterium SU_2_1]
MARHQLRQFPQHHKKTWRPSLRAVLIVPFLLQTLGIVGLVGYLSYRSGQKAVEELAHDLMMEKSNRLRQHLNSYLGQAQDINDTNLDAFKAGVLDLKDFQSLGKYFYRQLKTFDFTYVNFGSSAGGFIGAGYKLSNQLEIAEVSSSKPSQFLSYAVDEQGNRLALKTQENPGVSELAWYQDAVKAGKQIWSSIYIWPEPYTQISISASVPVYDQQKKLLGVFGIDLALSQISEFLKTLDSQGTGRLLIMERSGLMVASSGQESLTPVVKGKPTRVNALQSNEPMTRTVAQTLIKQFGRLEAIQQPKFFHADLAQNPSIAKFFHADLTQHLFIKVMPYQDQYGLDWLVVMVTPKSDFVAEIQANRDVTILICLVTLILSTGLGLITSNWIAVPIRHLNAASEAIARQFESRGQG